MEDLIHHLVDGIVANPDDVAVNTVDGEAVVTFELSVHADDRDRVEGDKGRTMRAILNILSAAAGSKKATLDLVDEGAEDSEE